MVAFLLILLYTTGGKLEFLCQKHSQLTDQWDIEGEPVDVPSCSFLFHSHPLVMLAICIDNGMPAFKTTYLSMFPLTT